MPASILWNRSPLPKNQFAPLPPTAFYPGGRLCGDIEAETPEALDGRLLRACLLHDEAAMDEASLEIRVLLDGDGPLEDAEIRALRLYHAVTADKEAATRLLRYARDLRDFLRDGGVLPPARAFAVGDLMEMALWLYNLTGQRVLLDVCGLLKAQAPDWMRTLHIFEQTRPARWKESDGDLYWRAHGPTVASSLRVPAMQALFEGGMKNETAFDIGWEKLTRWHGAGHGLFSAEPLLSGTNPSRGVDAAILPPLMRTFGTLLWARGSARMGDLMEWTAYGPLRAARGAQAANQLMPGQGARAEGFGAFAALQWMASQDGGLAAVGYAPGEVRWRLDGKPVRCVVETDYPYGETVKITISCRGAHSEIARHEGISPEIPTDREAMTFPLWLRIPAWAEGAVCRTPEGNIPCKGGAFARIEREWRDGDVVELTLPMQARAVGRPRQSVSVERGPLGYALPVEEGSAWRVALAAPYGFEAATESGIPVLYARGVITDAWERSGDRPGELPIGLAVEEDALEKVRLIPYGETEARISQFPAVKVETKESKHETCKDVHDGVMPALPEGDALDEGSMRGES